MVALEITDIKNFMNQLLKSDIFDHFLLQQATIKGAASYIIDGQIAKGFYSESELEELGLSDYTFLPFSILRADCFHLIKGKKTPSSFQFIFLLSPENLSRTLSHISSTYTPNDISGIYLNLKYQNQLLTLTTGISYRIFSTDKTLELEWDQMVKQFLNKHQITYEEL